MRKFARIGVCAAALLLAAHGARADSSSALSQQENFRASGGSLNAPTIPQTGPQADAIKKNLTQIELPPGFHIGLYAMVPGAREIAVGPQGVAVFVGTMRGDVYAVFDHGHTGVANEVRSFAPNIKFVMPNGVCFSKDGFLYVAERNRVLEFGAAEFFSGSADVAVDTVVPEGQLIPKKYESFNHTARYCRIGPDNKLYITVGQPYNVPPPDLIDDLQAHGLGAIIRMNRDGSDREIYALGIRNSVGLDFNPKDHTLWFTDNQVDGMGDDIPPGELNRATTIGENFGFPWYGGGHTRTNEYKTQTPPAGVVFPQVEEIAHAADLGMIFYTGQTFPAKYDGAIFSAQHGSWNRTVPVGARVMVTFLKKDGTADQSEPFASGWLNENGQYLGRPVDVAMLPDGSLLVSDDFAGALYRIWYDGK
ncbi:MAG TPA: PQQ-dependent sugar dehydrogenase [Acetobacteraceae bacterium]|nr:PQQ-dependent sugar dehydrogenase [Acetobacteraceae bacterium]